MAINLNDPKKAKSPERKAASNPKIATSRPPVIRSKEDIEAEIKRLEVLLKEVPQIRADAILDSIEVWKNRLAEYKK